MRKVKCVYKLYDNIALDSVYDVVEYSYKPHIASYKIKLYNDNNILKEYRMNTLSPSGILTEIFVDVTREYRDEIIDNIIK